MQTSFADLFTPKLVTIFREHYGWGDLRADLIAGLTVAIVALPLSMAIAIASGVTPDRGLYAAIAGGFVVSALGGSRFQIGGPAGAFIVLVAATADRFGVDGVILATLMSGAILLVGGFLRLGTFIRYIPYPVTVGFTAGIAAIIFASQLRELFGLSLPGKEPGPLIDKLPALFGALPSFQPSAPAVALFTLAVILAIRRWRPHWPGFLIAVALASCAAWALSLPVDTIGTRFGGIPRSLPAPHWPAFSPARLLEMLPSALSFSLLGGIESLLSAVVADSMTGRRHRSNAELVAQGAANIASALFGGMCVTGTIARTATNVRAGARGPIAGMAHSLFLLLFMLLAAPLAAYIPLAALAALLTVVAWNMAERHAVAMLLRASYGDAIVLGVTFLLVVFRDLTEGILIGFGLGALLFLHRLAQTMEIKQDAPNQDQDGAVYRISGAFFFGTAAGVAIALDRPGEQPKRYVIEFSAVPVIDSTAAATIAAFARKAGDRGAMVVVCGANAGVRRALLSQGVRRPIAVFRKSAG
jgi:SulP family sulfate permease